MDEDNLDATVTATASAQPAQPADSDAGSELNNHEIEQEDAPDQGTAEPSECSKQDSKHTKDKKQKKEPKAKAKKNTDKETDKKGEKRQRLNKEVKADKQTAKERIALAKAAVSSKKIIDLFVGGPLKRSRTLDQ